MKRFIDAGGYNSQIDEVVNNALDKRQFSDLTTPAANVEFWIEHGFGTVAVGFIVISQNKAAITYKSPDTPWDNNKIYLMTNTSDVIMRVLVF